MERSPERIAKSIADLATMLKGNQFLECLRGGRAVCQGYTDNIRVGLYSHGYIIHGFLSLLYQV